MSERRYLPIADYALLSDCHSTALISRYGSIDWACLGRFDAASTFGRLLDFDRGGYFSIRPSAPILDVERHYLPGTLVLVSTMRTEQGALRCTDGFAMAPGGSLHPGGQLLRFVECVEGSVEIDVEVEPRFDYGSTRPWLRRHPDRRITAVGGSAAIIIDTTEDLVIDQHRSRLALRTTLGGGESFAVSLVGTPAHLIDRSTVDCELVSTQIDTTTEWWTKWSAATTADGEHAALVSRSAVVLKGLTCAPTGAIVAAPTTSLPEVAGGNANWDYRYSWVRDSTMVLAALADVGHHEVAQGFRDFLIRSSAGHGDELQIMYGPYGERSLPERELPLEGWRSSFPVRTGNGAASQSQLDVYGHLLDAAHLWHTKGTDIDPDEWDFLTSVVNQAALRAEEPDSGMWEMRGEPRHFVESKAMIWVALDRGLRMVDDHDYPCSAADQWRATRDTVRTQIETLGVDNDRGIFVQSYGSNEVDASLLKLPLIGFIDANDERMRRTTEAIMDELGVGAHGFLRRYRHDGSDPSGSGMSGSGTSGTGRAGVDESGVGETEGVFLLCSFWLVEVLALQGRVGEATELFRALAALGNDVGLFAEEFDIANNEMLGNYPQAFTHLGLISAERCLRNAER